MKNVMKLFVLDAIKSSDIVTKVTIAVRTFGLMFLLTRYDPVGFVKQLRIMIVGMIMFA